MGGIEDSLLPAHVAALDEYEVTHLAAGYSHSAALTSQVGLRQIIDLRNTGQQITLLILVTEFNNNFELSYHSKRSDLPFFTEEQSQEGEKHGFVYA